MRACAVLLIVALSPVAATPRTATPRELRQDWNRLLRAWDERWDLDGFPYLGCFRRAAEESRVPLPLLIGLAWGESAFDPRARSAKDAIGIMQIRWPVTARELGFRSIEQLEDPCGNIRAGARYLRQLLDRVEDDPVLALASYNHGPTAIDGDDRNLDDHALWYVSYIYDKAAAVIAGRRWPDGRATLRLGRFTDYAMARVAGDRYRRLARLRESAELELSIQRNAEATYELRVLCASAERLVAERERYERITGFAPN